MGRSRPLLSLSVYLQCHAVYLVQSFRIRRNDAINAQWSHGYFHPNNAGPSFFARYINCTRGSATRFLTLSSFTMDKTYEEPHAGTEESGRVAIERTNGVDVNRVASVSLWACHSCDCALNLSAISATTMKFLIYLFSQRGQRIARRKIELRRSSDVIHSPTRAWGCGRSWKGRRRLSVVALAEHFPSACAWPLVYPIVHSGMSM